MIWHCGPWKAPMHAQTYMFGNGVKHDPPFWHGFEAHSFISVSHNNPVNPLKQLHVSILSLQINKNRCYSILTLLAWIAIQLCDTRSVFAGIWQTVIDYKLAKRSTVSGKAIACVVEWAVSNSLAHTVHATRTWLTWLKVGVKNNLKRVDLFRVYWISSE